jgi:hypothetical protein
MEDQLSNTKPEIDPIAAAFFALIENRQIKTFSELKMAGKITPEIEEDFRRYCEVAREIFEKVGGNFNVNMVHQLLPNNKWIILFYDYRSTKEKSIVKHKLTVQ